MSSKSVIIIGGGPGGYAAALEAVRRKMTVILIEEQEMGGTCLNRGCIPSKIFLIQIQAICRRPPVGRRGHPGAPGKNPHSPLLEQKTSVVTTLRQAHGAGN